MTTAATLMMKKALLLEKRKKKKPLGNCFFLAPHNPGASSQVDPPAIPSRASDTNAINLSRTSTTYAFLDRTILN
jgi:hypothetical protein